MNLLKSIKKIIKYVKKLNNWEKIILFFIVILLLTKINNMVSGNEIMLEGFEQREKYVEKKGLAMYDDFYCNIYDELVYDEVKIEFEVDEMMHTTNLNKNSILLDIGSGLGHHVASFNDKNINAVGMDQSVSMVKCSRSKHPNSTFKVGNALENMTFEHHRFSHITALYFTLYYINDKITFFKNCYDWLKPGGFLIVHLVNRDKFDPILYSADPLNMVSAQKYAKKRITNSLVKFKDFQYKANFELKYDIGYFDESFKDDKTKHVRVHKHKLYMEKQKDILSLAKDVGFKMKGKIDLVQCMYEYQYLYVLYKPK